MILAVVVHMLILLMSSKLSVAVIVSHVDPKKMRRAHPFVVPMKRSALTAMFPK